MCSFHNKCQKNCVEFALEKPDQPTLDKNCENVQLPQVFQFKVQHSNDASEDAQKEWLCSFHDECQKNCVKFALEKPDQPTLDKTCENVQLPQVFEFKVQHPNDASEDAQKEWLCSFHNECQKNCVEFAIEKPDQPTLDKNCENVQLPQVFEFKVQHQNDISDSRSDSSTFDFYVFARLKTIYSK